MDITPLVQASSQIIQGYSPGQFRVSGTLYDGAIIVSPGGVQIWDYKGDPAHPVVEDFAQILEQDGIDVVLFGCGAKMAFLPRDMKQVFLGKGMTIEAMDSGAACRTYNVLMAEGRRVAALLLPV